MTTCQMTPGSLQPGSIRSSSSSSQAAARSSSSSSSSTAACRSTWRRGACLPWGTSTRAPPSREAPLLACKASAQGSCRLACTPCSTPGTWGRRLARPTRPPATCLLGTCCQACRRRLPLACSLPCSCSTAGRHLVACSTALPAWACLPSPACSPRACPPSSSSSRGSSRTPSWRSCWRHRPTAARRRPSSSTRCSRGSRSTWRRFWALAATPAACRGCPPCRTRRSTLGSCRACALPPEA
jgi:hypothetical protein